MKQDSPERCLTVDQMASEMGLECCDFTAERPNDCDICGDAVSGEHIWVRMAGSYEGSSVEAEYYACSKCVAASMQPFAERHVQDRRQ